MQCKVYFYNIFYIFVLSMAKKALIMTVIAAACLCACTHSPLPSPSGNQRDRIDWQAATEYVFDDSSIPEVHIKVSQTEWDKLLSAYDANHDTEEFVKCDAEFIKDGEISRIPHSGLRLKGNTSRRRPQTQAGQLQHCHYKIDFHHFEPNAYHTLKGFRSINLKWFKDDPAYVRELFCFDLFRRFGVWTATREIYTRLWLKAGEASEKYLGVYGLTEQINKDFLYARKDLFGSADGMLWKCRFGADLHSKGHDYAYELKTNEDKEQEARAQLNAFIEKLNAPVSEPYFKWLESCIDIDLLLRTYAVNVVVGMWDDYWNNANNYYLYFTPEGRVFFIPYDYDNTLGTSLKCGAQEDAGRQDPYNWGLPENVLIHNVLKNSAWKARYKEYLQELCSEESLCLPSSARGRIKAWQERIMDYVANDTGEDMYIQDRPAPWGNHPEYRLLESGKNNYFDVKAAVISAMQ